MKLSIALVLSHHAERIIMDEPTFGLDPVVRHEILYLMAELLQDGEKTIFFSTGALPGGQGRGGAFECG